MANSEDPQRETAPATADAPPESHSDFAEVERIETAPGEVVDVVEYNPPEARVIVPAGKPLATFRYRGDPRD